MDEQNLENEVRYSDEYIIKNGIQYEEYLALPENERRAKFPFGSFTFSGLTIATTFEHHQVMLEHEDKMTADLMEREGLKVNYELREKFPNSYFKPECYDDSIVGVNAATQSILYDVEYYGRLAVMFIEWSSPKYKDMMYRATKAIRWAKTITYEDLNGKVPPTFILKNDEKFIELWDDLQDPWW